MKNETDARPDPKPRKHPHLWQAYLWWEELEKMRIRHILRISSIEKGKSAMGAQFERDMMTHMDVETLVCYAKKEMITFGETVGPIWDWLNDIRGIGEYSAVKLLARIDDIGKFATVSKLWRFAGLAVIDGKAEKKDSQHYNRILKASLIGKDGIADQFNYHSTFPYRDEYLIYKARQRETHPDVICRQCGCKWEDCEDKKSHTRMYNDGHLHMRAKRKIAKLFLSHLWTKWREFEGLSVSTPYVQAILGHTNIVEVDVHDEVQ